MEGSQSNNLSSNTNEVSNSNPFDVLNTINNDMELGTNGGTLNSGNKGANSSGSSFCNVKNSSTSTTPIIDKIRKYENLIIDGQAILMDDAGNPLKKVGFGTQSLLEQWRNSYGNGDYDDDPYDDNMYEGQDLPEELQTICDHLDIRLLPPFYINAKQLVMQLEELVRVYDEIAAKLTWNEVDRLNYVPDAGVAGVPTNEIAAKLKWDEVDRLNYPDVVKTLNGW
ncbi:hypothetical protein Tco_0600580 [Tanacetum coccineum]